MKGKKQPKRKGEKQRPSTEVRSPFEAPARAEGIQGEQELEEKDLDSVAGGVSGTAGLPQSITRNRFLEAGEIGPAVPIEGWGELGPAVPSKTK